MEQVKVRKKMYMKNTFSVKKKLQTEIKNKTEITEIKNKKKIKSHEWHLD